MNIRCISLCSWKYILYTYIDPTQWKNSLLQGAFTSFEKITHIKLIVCYTLKKYSKFNGKYMAAGLPTFDRKIYGIP